MNEDQNPMEESIREWSKKNIEDISKILCHSIKNTKKMVKDTLKGKNPDVVEKPTKPMTESLKPNREKIIQKDELTNLKILLEKSMSVDDFLKNI